MAIIGRDDIVFYSYPLVADLKCKDVSRCKELLFRFLLNYKDIQEQGFFVCIIKKLL
jgi:hypothetical protein